jgi:hypothetical protein
MSRRNLTIALILVIVTFSAIPVGIGHGVAPAVLFFLASEFPGLALLLWFGLCTLLAGRSRFPESSGRTLLTVGAIAFALAGVYLALIGEGNPRITVLLSLPLDASCLWLTIESWRGLSDPPRAGQEPPAPA